MIFKEAQGLRMRRRVFGQSWRISVLVVEGLRGVELSERDSHLFVVRCGYNHVC